MRVLILVLCVAATSAVAHEADRLPLGDGKLTAVPRRGYLLACTSVVPGPGGAFRAGDWIAAGAWDPASKPIVEGDVAWPAASITVMVEGTARVVRTNGLPIHGTGEFPIRQGTAAYAFDRNPNRIEQHPEQLSLPKDPVVAAQPRCVPRGAVGVALSGVAIFNAADLGGRDAPAHEIQDRCNGHPEMNGQYHYHNWSPCLAVADPDAPVGWMLDGYPILGPVDADGHRLTNADLDECHGRVGPVTLPDGTSVQYHYRLTMEYPYTIGCFHGVVSIGLMPPSRR